MEDVMQVSNAVEPLTFNYCTSARWVMFSPGVCLFVCLSVNDLIFMKILPDMYLYTRSSPLNSGGHPNRGSLTDPPWLKSECSYDVLL